MLIKRNVFKTVACDFMPGFVNAPDQIPVFFGDTAQDEKSCLAPELSEQIKNFIDAKAHTARHTANRLVGQGFQHILRMEIFLNICGKYFRHTLFTASPSQSQARDLRG